MFITSPFLTMHGPRGNHSDQSAITAEREADVKQSPGVRAAKSLQPDLANTVANILDDQQRFVEKGLLSFRLTDVALFGAIATIAFVSVQSFDLCKIKHLVYYHQILN